MHGSLHISIDNLRCLKLFCRGRHSHWLHDLISYVLLVNDILAIGMCVGILILHAVQRMAHTLYFCGLSMRKLLYLCNFHPHTPHTQCINLWSTV